jgi:hypothetical protein
VPVGSPAIRADVVVPLIAVAGPRQLSPLRRRPRCSCRHRAGTAPSTRGRSSGSVTSSCSDCCRGSATSRPAWTSWTRECATLPRPSRRQRSICSRIQRRRVDLGELAAEVPVPEERHPLLERARGVPCAIRSSQKWVSSRPRSQSRSAGAVNCTDGGSAGHGEDVGDGGGDRAQAHQLRRRAVDDRRTRYGAGGV